MQYLSLEHARVCGGHKHHREVVALLLLHLKIRQLLGVVTRMAVVVRRAEARANLVVRGLTSPENACTYDRACVTKSERTNTGDLKQQIVPMRKKLITMTVKATARPAVSALQVIGLLEVGVLRGATPTPGVEKR
jgi:hypothetical protein